jgi:pyruvate kinase
MSTPPSASDLAAPSILTSIVATIGPASDSPEMVKRLILGGVGVFRFNFSHGDFAAHARRLSTVRAVAKEMDFSIACLGDLQGPKIRVGKIPAGVGEPHSSGGGAIRVETGQDVVFKRDLDLAFMRPGPAAGHGGVMEPVLPVTYQPLIGEVQPGHKVLINDGAIRMLAVESDAARGELRCRVTVGGLISSSKGINLPNSELSAPSITERDIECVHWAVQNDMDYLALSFVRRAEDVEQLRALLATIKAPGTETGAWIPIVSKVEMPEAVKDLHRVVAASDAVMVARGDLGVEMDIAVVPVVQKRILAECARQGKPCIVATQMLETMIENPIPTRAEATDIATAIFDGADAVMLSAETATGKHPALVVETMARIAAATEAAMAECATRREPPSQMAAAHAGTAALAHGAWQMSRDLGAVAIATWSEHGGTARYLSQNRFTVPIIAFSSDDKSCRQMSLLRGVTAVCQKPPGSGTLSEWNKHVDDYLLARGLARHGDAIILVAGRPLGQAKRTNTVAIHRVGEATGYTSHTERR